MDVFKVDPEHNQERLDVFLTGVLSDSPSRSFVKKLIDQGCVTLNDSPVKAHHKVHEGDEVHVDIPDAVEADETIAAENIPLNIFYEDDELAVINKPEGMVVHPSPGCYQGTLVNALLYHYKQLSDVNTTMRPGIVHRLDQDTSGLMVVAKDNRTHGKIAKQFQQKKVKKRYVAVVDGEVEFDEGRIEAPLGRHPTQREKKDVQYHDDAKDALTQYRVIQRHKGKTLVALYPQTGRTHQLRVHMKHLGHPILGDGKYGKKSSFPRLALHAQSLGFIHPKRKQWVEFSTPTPKEFLTAVGLKR